MVSRMKKPGYISKEKEYRKRAKELVSQMTDEEKISQLIFKAKAIDRLGIPKYNWWNEKYHDEYLTWKGRKRKALREGFRNNVIIVISDPVANRFEKDGFYKQAA